MPGVDYIVCNGPEGWIFSHLAYALFFFPILYTAPQDTIAPPDTVGIVTPSPLDPMVDVLPNPATDHVLVESEVGLERLEIYNSAGALVATLSVSGTSAGVDTRTLPAGNYVLKVHTPIGSVGKKLIISR